MIQDANKTFEEQEKVLINYLTREEKDMYLAIQVSDTMDTDGSAEYELSKMMRVARGREHDANNPNSPLCQWAMEMLSKPLQHWLKKAAELGHVEAKYDYLIQIESPRTWDEVRSGYTELMTEHNHIDSIERLAFLYTDKGAMNKPQVVPELDYEEANALLMVGVNFGAEWLYHKVLHNYDEMIKLGKASAIDKELFIEKTEPTLKHEKIELPKEYEKAMKSIYKSMDYKCIDSVNVEKIANRINFGTFSFFSSKKPSKDELKQKEVAKHLNKYIENKKKEIEK